MNVALVVLDTLRKDAFDRHFDWLDGRRFENAWAPSNWTAPVHASLFTGYYASEVGVHAKATALNCDRSVLAEHLSNTGYTTRAFSANPNVSRRFGFDRGFDEFDGSWKVRHFNQTDIFDWSKFVAESNGRGLRTYYDAFKHCITEDVDTLTSLKHGVQLRFFPDSLRNESVDDGAQTVLERIKSTDYGHREFLFVNLMEAHGPYDPPESYRNKPDVSKPAPVEVLAGTADNEDEVAIRQAYDDAVAYLADVYQEIHRELREDFDYVITLSDHGELLGEHGLWDHQYGLYPELTHVPLVVSGDELSGSTDACVSLLDVHRTVLDLTDVEAPSRGNSLVPEAQPRHCLTEYHGLTSWLVDELQKLASEETVAGYDTTYRGIALPKSYYGYESEDGWQEQGYSDIEPQVAFEAAIHLLDEREEETEDQELSNAAMERLEDLGYA